MQQAEYYENDTTLAQYLEFHFGERWHGEANFPKALADAAMNAMDGRPLDRALDIGCAVGRTAACCAWPYPAASLSCPADLW